MVDTAIPIAFRAQDGIVVELFAAHPSGLRLDECYPADLGVTAIPAGTIITVGMTWDGIVFGPVPPAPAPAPAQTREVVGYLLISALTDAQVTALSTAKAKDQRLLSARADPWPENNPKIARIADKLGLTPAAWFDVALTPPAA